MKNNQLIGADCAAENAMIKQLTGTDEAAGRRCLSGLQVLIKQLTGADQLVTGANPAADSW